MALTRHVDQASGFRFLTGATLLLANFLLSFLIFRGPVAPLPHVFLVTAPPLVAPPLVAPPLVAPPLAAPLAYLKVLPGLLRSFPIVFVSVGAPLARSTGCLNMFCSTSESHYRH